jgi:hypothetical protein
LSRREREVELPEAGVLLPTNKHPSPGLPGVNNTCKDGPKAPPPLLALLMCAFVIDIEPPLLDPGGEAPPVLLLLLLLWLRFPDMEDVDDADVP